MSATLETIRLGESEARTLTDEVKADAAALWEKCLRLYEGEAHKALGYSSWGSFWEAEFGRSDADAYRVLQAARVVGQLPIGSPTPNEAQARELVPLAGDEVEVVEAWREAQVDAAEHGQRLSAKVVKNAVSKRIGRLQREAKSEAAKTWECDECGQGGDFTSVGCTWAFNGEGNSICRCNECAGKIREQKERERQEWWESLSEDERQAHTRAEEDRENHRKLDGSLQSLLNPEGGGSLAEYLRYEFGPLSEIDLTRHPDQLTALCGAVDELFEIVGEFKTCLTHSVLVIAETEVVDDVQLGADPPEAAP